MEQAQISCRSGIWVKVGSTALALILSWDSQLRPVVLSSEEQGPSSKRSWQSEWLCSESSYLCTKKLNIMSRTKTRDKGFNWGRELRRVGAAVQLSVLGRGISNLWVKSWVRTLPALFLFLWRLELCPSNPLWEGGARFTPWWCGRLTFVQRDGCSSFPASKKALPCFRAAENSGRVAEATGGFLSLCGSQKPSGNVQISAGELTSPGPAS